MEKIINYIMKEKLQKNTKNTEDVGKIYSKKEIERQMKQEALRITKIIN